MTIIPVTSYGPITQLGIGWVMGGETAPSSRLGVAWFQLEVDSCQLWTISNREDQETAAHHFLAGEGISSESVCALNLSPEDPFRLGLVMGIGRFLNVSGSGCDSINLPARADLVALLPTQCLWVQGD